MFEATINFAFGPRIDWLPSWVSVTACEILLGSREVDRNVCCFLVVVKMLELLQVPGASCHTCSALIAKGFLVQDVDLDKGFPLLS